jgi:two-component sensor histidine kinase
MLVLRVEDDGPGFESTDIDDMATRGLGLFVARELALLHTRNGRQGSLALYNGGCYGGAVFELRLP